MLTVTENSIGPMVKKINPQIVGALIEKICSLKLQNSVDNSVQALALRAVVEALPRPVPGAMQGKEVNEAYGSVSRVLIPRFLGHPSPSSRPTTGLLNLEDPNSDAVDVLIELVRCFGPILQSFEIEALHSAVVTILDKDRGNSVVKKRAVVALSMLAHYLPDELLADFIGRSVEVLSSDNIKDQTRRLYITVLGSMARSIPYRFGRFIPTLVPHLLQVLSEDNLQAHLDEYNENGAGAFDFNEIQESALVTLEAFLSSCPIPMRDYTLDAIEACNRYLKFDPNYAFNDEDEVMEDEEEEDEFDEDDEYEDAGTFDDDDDSSWKVRRAAAKGLHAIISTRSSGDLLESGVLYQRVGSALVKRLNEREENVRLEVLSALSLLVRKTGEGVVPDLSGDSSQSEFISISQPPPSRKRRRQSSVAGATTFAPETAALDLFAAGLASPTSVNAPSTGPRADLAALTPAIIKSLTKWLKSKLIPTKQACINLLDDLVAVQRGGLASYFDQIIEPIIDAVKTSAGSASSGLTSTTGNASATAVTLRIAALRLIGDIVKHHSSSVLQPYLSKIVVAVVSVAHDRFYKISGEAIQTAEELTKVITPPRARMTSQKFEGDLQKIYEVVIDRTTANDADAEVRQKAIHALGTLLARTSGTDGSSLLPADKRKAAFDCLLERIKNETTRLFAVRAVDTAAAMSQDTAQFDSQWVREVVVELAAQLRKSNRALRGSSVMALKHLILSPGSKGTLDQVTVQNVVGALIPVITNNDAQLLGPGLLVLAHLVLEMPAVVMTPQLISALCHLLHGTVSGSVLESLLVLVTNAGRAGQGGPLMKALLKEVGVAGEPAVVGKVIGTLLVASDSTAGVTLDSFVKEIETSAGDQARASLALSVIGEAGLRLGTKFPILPSLFLKQFSHDYDKVSVAAAVALGRAGAGNIATYLPAILDAMNQEGGKQYLLLQSIKEILQQASLNSTDLGQYSAATWDQILAATDKDDNKAVAAECIGRMAIIDPKTYMSKLEVCVLSLDSVFPEC